VLILIGVYLRSSAAKFLLSAKHVLSLISMAHRNGGATSGVRRLISALFEHEEAARQECRTRQAIQ
jgi:hypothetical protein